MEEKAQLIKLIDLEGKVQEVKFYVHFRKSQNVYMSLLSHNMFVECNDYNYTECLVEILKKLPVGYSLKFQSKVNVINNESSFETIVIDEYASLINPEQNEEYWHVNYHLRSTHKGVDYEANATEDYYYALKNLKRDMNLGFSICFYCENADFKSDGSEDLRHGWYCLRELNDRKKDIPWFQREEEFEKAISNVDALHWCPMFREVIRE